MVLLIINELIAC